ncbi:MAG: nucleotidyltransferase substrate binding protein [Planctomycetaceae bacterium]|jgi:hypothetical protein|nr:nucleotidyltransferase substrate binding protein [Planctomycetaceae bacterium]
MQKRNADKLQNAMKSLEDALSYSRSGEFQGLGIEFKSVLISAVVQNFGLTFAVCRQMIERQLADRLGGNTAGGLSTDSLFRTAAKEGLISNLNHWLEYMDCEHLTPSGSIALRTFEKAAAFLEDAGELLRTCNRREQHERRRAA